MEPKIRSKVTRMIYELESLRRELQELSYEINMEIKGIRSSDYSQFPLTETYPYKRVSSK